MISPIKRVAIITIFALCAFSQTAFANQDEILREFDSLGGNDVLLDRAKALNPDASIRIVQDRMVDRRWREELSLEYMNVLGAEAYTSTQSLGANYNVHITPQWSVGAKYGYFFNGLSREGEYLIKDTAATGKGIIPALDYAKQMYMGLVNWYPVYGKMNLYDLGVVHFDVYALGGFGQVELKSGRTSTWTGGGGIGFWFSQRFTTRLEMRYQSYQAKFHTGPTPMDLTVASVQMGYLHDLF